MPRVCVFNLNPTQALPSLPRTLPPSHPPSLVRTLSPSHPPTLTCSSSFSLQMPMAVLSSCTTLFASSNVVMNCSLISASRVYAKAQSSSAAIAFSNSATACKVKREGGGEERGEGRVRVRDG